MECTSAAALEQEYVYAVGQRQKQRGGLWRMTRRSEWVVETLSVITAIHGNTLGLMSLQHASLTTQYTMLTCVWCPRCRHDVPSNSCYRLLNDLLILSNRKHDPTSCLQKNSKLVAHHCDAPLEVFKSDFLWTF